MNYANLVECTVNYGMNNLIRLINMKRLLFVIIPALLYVGSLNAQQTWTLQQCIEYALEHNISLKQQSNRIKQVKIERKDLKNSFLPDLNMGASQKLDFGRSLNRDNVYEDSNSQSSSFSLTSEMPLFTGFSKINSISRNKYDLLAAQQELATIENDLSLSITAAYFQILLNKEIYRISLEQIELTKEQETKTQLLIENGRAPHSQLYDVLAQLADDELHATEAKNSLRLAYLELKQLLEWEEDEAFEIAPLQIQPEMLVIDYPGDIYMYAMNHMPEIKRAEYDMKSSLKRIKVAQADYYPILSLGAGISSSYYHLNGIANPVFNEQFKNNMQKSIYLSLKIPLFNRFSTRNRVKSARVDADNVRLAYENEKKDLYKKIENAYTDAVTAKDKLNATAKSVEANQEAHRYALERYSAGKSNVFEYNESKLKLANALSQQAQAKYMYLLKGRVLEFYKGNSLNK